MPITNLKIHYQPKTNSHCSHFSYSFFSWCYIRQTRIPLRHDNTNAANDSRLTAAVAMASAIYSAEFILEKWTISFWMNCQLPLLIGVTYNSGRSSRYWCQQMSHHSLHSIPWWSLFRWLIADSNITGGNNCYRSKRFHEKSQTEHRLHEIRMRCCTYNKFCAILLESQRFRAILNVVSK